MSLTPPTFVLHEDWCCPGHAQRVNADPSINAVAWPLALLTLASSDLRVLRRCGYDGEEGSADGDMLGPVLSEIGRLCCFLSAAQLEESYKACRRPLTQFHAWRKAVGNVR